MTRFATNSIRLAVLCLVALPGGAAAQDCSLEGRQYPENATVCSNGLALFCGNGTWQSSDGARCNTPSGTYVDSRRPIEEKNTEPIPEFYKEKYPSLDLR